MTEFVIKLRDDSKVGLLLGLLYRFVTSHGVDLSVEQNGRGIVLDDDMHFDEAVNQIIEEAMAGTLAPLTEEEQRESAEYWERKGEELNLTDDDIVRIVNEYRADQRAQTVA